MVVAPPPSKQKAPPIPKRFTPAFRQAEAQRRSQEQQSSQQQTVTVQESVQQKNIFEQQKEVFDYYNKIYGPVQAERYKDLYFAQIELENLQKAGANFQLIFEQQKRIAGIQQDIARTAGAGQSTKGVGIDTTITKKSGQKIILKSSETGQQSQVIDSSVLTGGYTGATGYTGIGYISTPTKPSMDFSPASNQNFLASSVKGPDYVITKQGVLKREPFTPREGGAVYSREEVFTQEQPKKLQGDVFLDYLSQVNEDLSQKYFPGYLKQFDVGIRRIKIVNEEGRFGVDIYGDTNKGLTTRVGGDKVSNIASAPGRAIYGTTKFLVGLTPFTGKPYETIFLTTGYVGEAYTNPIARGQKTVAEFGEYISERGLIAFGAESYVGARTLNPFFEPFENFALTKFSRTKERILGTDYESLLKNYSVENVGGSIVIRSKTSGRFAPTSKAPIRMEPTKTIITEPSYLKSLEGQTVLAVHTSPNFQYGGIIETVSKKISGEKESITLTFQEQRGIRKRLENAPFYFSVPRPGSNGVPTAQLGYAGFRGSSLLEVARPQKIVFFKKTPTMILTKAKVEPTGRPLNGFDIPSKLSPLEERTVRISAEQERFPGRFTRAPEEVSGLRPFGAELQIVVPTKSTEFPLTGRPQSVGSTLIKQKRLGERIFYETREPVLFKFLPERARLSLFESDFSKRPAKLNLDYGKIVAKTDFSAFTDVKQEEIYNLSGKREREIIRVQEYSPRDVALELSKTRIDIREPIGRERRTLPRTFEPRPQRMLREERRRETIRELERIVGRERSGRETFRERERFRLEERIPRLNERNRPLEEYTPRGRGREPEITRRPPERPRPRKGPPLLPPIRPPGKTRKDSPVQPIRGPAFEPGFVAYYVTGGKRGEKVSEQRYTYRDVFNIGAIGVQSSIKRTFEIVQEGVATPRNIQGPTNILRPGKKPGTFVEKTEYAISTPLEKRTLKLAKQSTIRRTKPNSFRSIKYA